MRRIGIAVVVGLFVGLLGGPAWAGRNIEVEDSEEPGSKLTVDAGACEFGPTWKTRSLWSRSQILAQVT